MSRKLFDAAQTGFFDASSISSSTFLEPRDEVMNMCYFYNRVLYFNKYLNIQSGNTPLILAAAMGRVTMVRALVDSGAQLDARDNVRLFTK